MSAQSGLNTIDRKPAGTLQEVLVETDEASVLKPQKYEALTMIRSNQEEFALARIYAVLRQRAREVPDENKPEAQIVTGESLTGEDK